MQLGNEPNRIDLMTTISGVTFEEAWAGRVAGPLGGIGVHFIGLRELRRDKASTGRQRIESIWTH